METTKRILVVDDEEQVRFVVSESLKALGNNLEIRTAENGTQALELFKEESFDLVITDLKMPGMDGFKLTESIKTINPKTAVIWMTAYGGESVKAEAHKLEIRRFLTKPLDIADFRKIAQQALDATARERKTEVFTPIEPNAALRMRLERMRRDSGATATLIITLSGLPIAIEGGHDDLDMSTLSALVAANFLAANEIARLLGRESKFKVSYHESDKHNIYAHGIGEKYLLVTIFGIKTRPGTVWFYAQRAAMDLLEILNDINIDNAQLDKIFTEEISSELDNLLETVWEPSAE
ncbi:MAG: response regulator [Chloroflexota bacterium]